MLRRQEEVVQLQDMALAWSSMTHFYTDCHTSQKPVKTQLTKTLRITDARFVQSLILLFPQVNSVSYSLTFSSLGYK